MKDVHWISLLSGIFAGVLTTALFATTAAKKPEPEPPAFRTANARYSRSHARIDIHFSDRTGALRCGWMAFDIEGRAEPAHMESCFWVTAKELENEKLFEAMGK